MRKGTVFLSGLLLASAGAFAQSDAGMSSTGSASSSGMSSSDTTTGSPGK